MKTDLTVAGYIFSDNKVLLIHHRQLNLWLGVGGHIKENETPDAALKREAKEEVNLDIEILNQSHIPAEGNVEETLALPFYVNVHSVGDHNHCGFFYLCRALNPGELKIKDDEVKKYKWFSKDELNQEKVPIDVRNQCLAAFELLEKSGFLYRLVQKLKR